MRAVVCRDAELEVTERSQPVPGGGQMRIAGLPCGICGSDLHARHGCDVWADLAMRVGYDRFARSDEPIVFGHELCEPVGLALILLLKAKGVRMVLASDYSPGRRALATACGADVVIDPGHESPFAAVTGRGHLDDIPAALELAVGTREKLERLPVDWWHVWRLGEASGARPSAR